MKVGVNQPEFSSKLVLQTFTQKMNLAFKKISPKARLNHLIN